MTFCKSKTIDAYFVIQEGNLRIFKFMPLLNKHRLTIKRAFLHIAFIVTRKCRCFFEIVILIVSVWIPLFYVS